MRAKQKIQYFYKHYNVTVSACLETITALRQKVRSLEKDLENSRHFASHDDLTGLPTRGLFRDRLYQATKLAARNQKSVALLLLDLNNFKNINDTHGHNIGDSLLKLFAKRLTASIRATDSVYRYGGDEFLILLPEVSDNRGPVELSHKLYALLRKPYHIGQLELVVTVSIGTAMYPEDGETQNELVGRADSAMYSNKSLMKSKQMSLQ